VSACRRKGGDGSGVSRHVGELMGGASSSMGLALLAAVPHTRQASASARRGHGWRLRHRVSDAIGALDAAGAA
jgi:hypothetical protein